MLPAASNSKDGPSDASPSDVHTIDLSNDSTTESSEKKVSDDRPRIYLKKDLANPDNLQPEMLMRFRDVVMPMNPSSGGSTGAIELDRNGINSNSEIMGKNTTITTTTTGSASDNDAPQD